MSKYYLAAWLCSILCLASDMGLHYLTFMGRNLENKKKLTPVCIMNCAGLNSKIIMNSAGIFINSALSSNLRE